MQDRRISRQLISVELVPIPNSLAEELLQIVNHFIAPVEIDVPKNDFVIKLALSDMFTEVDPLV